MTSINNIDISNESSYISIFNHCKLHDEFIDLCDFFQYQTANAKDSPLSLQLDSILTDAQKNELLDKLYAAIHICESDFVFNSLLRNKIKLLQAMGLSDSTLTCDRIKGFFHQNNPNPKGRSQHQIDSLFKHIRNAFAHGRICIKGDYLIMEDKQNELTARVIITSQALKIWKSVIESYLVEIKE